MKFNICAAGLCLPRALSVLAVAVAFSGCVSGKALEANTERLRQMESKLESMQTAQKAHEETSALMLSSLKNQGEMAAGFARLSDTVTVLGGRVEELNARTILLGQKLDNVKASAEVAQEPRPDAIGLEAELRAINLRLEKISERLRKSEAGAGQDASLGAAPSASGGAPADVYHRAYEAFLSGDYDSAKTGFSGYLSKSANGEFADMAAYWLAEAMAGKGDAAEARDAFDRMAESYPSSGKAATAFLRGAEMSVKLEDKGGAVKRLKAVMEYYPDSPEAKKAAAMLKETGR